MSVAKKPQPDSVPWTVVSNIGKKVDGKTYNSYLEASAPARKLTAETGVFHQAVRT